MQLSHSLLFLEYEALILVFCVPQSVQKMENEEFHKAYRIMEQKSDL
jgi:hypothetical protein